MSFKSNFHFLEAEFPLLLNIGQSAEYYVYSDPVVSVSKLRFWGEKVTEVLFEKHGLAFPEENTFHNRLKTLQFEGVLPDSVADLFFNLKTKGNKAVHTHEASESDAKGALFTCFKLAKWFFETYADSDKDLSQLRFKVPPDLDARHALGELGKEYEDLEARF